MLVRPCQSVALLQHLVRLRCRPMREGQSLLHTAQMKLKAGRVFAASALLFRFLVTPSPVCIAAFIQ